MNHNRAGIHALLQVGGPSLSISSGPRRASRVTMLNAMIRRADPHDICRIGSFRTYMAWLVFRLVRHPVSVTGSAAERSASNIHGTMAAAGHGACSSAHGDARSPSRGRLVALRKGGEAVGVAPRVAMVGALHVPRSSKQLQYRVNQMPRSAPSRRRSCARYPVLCMEPLQFKWAGFGMQLAGRSGSPWQNGPCALARVREALCYEDLYDNL